MRLLHHIHFFVKDSKKLNELSKIPLRPLADLLVTERGEVLYGALPSQHALGRHLAAFPSFEMNQPCIAVAILPPAES